MFTTRPDTIFGATYLVLAPEHPLRGRADDGGAARGGGRVPRRARRSRTSSRGRRTRRRPASSPGRSRVNPATGEPIPVWIADYVLMEYGTGAIMAVPGHDERDFEFATKFELPIVRVVAGRRRRRAHAARRAVHRDGRRALVNSRAVRRARRGRGDSADHRVARRRTGTREGGGELPAARLVHLAPALLGAADPDHLLRRLRHGAGAGEGPAGAAAAHRGLPARRHRRLAARAPRGVVSRAVPDVRRSRRVARPTCRTPSSTARGTSCAIRAPSTTTSPFDAERDEEVAAGGLVHRRQRARGAAPAVLALHHDGAARRRARRLRGAVQALPRARPDHPRRREDVEERRATS